MLRTELKIQKEIIIIILTRTIHKNIYLKTEKVHKKHDQNNIIQIIKKNEN